MAPWVEGTGFYACRRCTGGIAAAVLTLRTCETSRRSRHVAGLRFAVPPGRPTVRVSDVRRPRTPARASTPSHVGKPALDGPGRDAPVAVHRPVESAPEQEEAVGVGHRLEQPQRAVRLHDLEDRREDRVVPVARALLGRDEPLDRARVVERVRLDRLLQLEIAVGVRESEPATGQRHIEPGHPAEAPLLGRGTDRRHRRAGREMEVGLELIDIRLDELPSRGDRHRQALVAVLDEIGVVDLEERDRHVDDAGVRRALCDGLAELRAASPEAPVEVVDAADGSDDVGDRDLPATDRQACHQAEAPADLFEGQEIGSVTPPQRRPHHRSVADGLAEITPVWRSPLAWRDGLQRSPAVPRAPARGRRRPRSTRRRSRRTAGAGARAAT